MNITLFLASLWGPILLAVGIGMFTSARSYAKIYRDLEQDALAVLVFGMLAMATGIAQIIFHNTWNTPLEAIISLLGWATLLKGTMLIVAPGFADRASAQWANKNLMPAIGVVLLLLGGYLSYLSYAA